MTEPAYLEIELRTGDDLEITIFDFPYDITNYTFSGAILDNQRNVVEDFIVEMDPLNRVVTYSLSSLILDNIDGEDKDFYFKQIDPTGFKQTFVEGPVIRKR